MSTRARQNSCFSPLQKVLQHNVRCAENEQTTLRDANNMPAAAVAPAQAHIIPDHAAQTTNVVQPIMQTYLRLNAVSE